MRVRVCVYVCGREYVCVKEVPPRSEDRNWSWSIEESEALMSMTDGGERGAPAERCN